MAALLAFVRQTLGDAVAEVRASDRLARSPACLVAGALGPDRRLERLLSAHGRLAEASKPVLELNPGHPLVTRLADALGEGGDKALVEDAAHLLLAMARAAEGDPPPDAAAFAERLARVVGRAIGGAAP